MKKLMLMRHGQAIKMPGQTDFERNLTERGMREVQNVALHLLKNEVYIDLVITSNAERTLETASIVIDTLDGDIPVIHLKELYNCSHDEILNILEKYAKQEYQTVLVVGHNPAITTLVANLSIEIPVNLVKNAMNFDVTAKLVSCYLNTDSWSDIRNAKGSVNEVYFPSI